jgi:hypothetical protein
VGMSGSYTNPEFESPEFSLGSDFESPSFSLEETKKITDFVKTTTKKEAVMNSSSKLLCVASRDADGTYTLRTSDGFDIPGVISTDVTVWDNATWVTGEQTKSGWSISGIGAFDGGPLPDQSG